MPTRERGNEEEKRCREEQQTIQTTQKKAGDGWIPDYARVVLELARVMSERVGRQAGEHLLFVDLRGGCQQGKKASGLGPGFSCRWL